jgi:hypothetical protein
MMKQSNMEQLKTRLTLFALWLFVLLNIIFRDIHQLTLKSHLEMLLTGYFNGMEVTDAIMLGGALIVNAPISMLLVSLLAKRRLSKGLNLAAATILTLSFFASPPTDMDDIFHLTVELIAIAAIVFTVIKWKESSLITAKEPAHELA